MLEFLHQTNLSLGPLYATLLLGITTFILLVCHSLQKQRYWKNLGIPCARKFPLIGSDFEYFRKLHHEVDMGRYKKYGKMYGHFEGNTPGLTVADPELIRLILVKDFQTFSKRRPVIRLFQPGDKIADKMLPNISGENWKKIRTIVSPTFTTGKIKRMLSIFKDCSKTIVGNFKTLAEKGEPVEMKSMYGAFTMDVIASSAFSTKIDSHNDPMNPFVQTANNVFIPKFSCKKFVIDSCLTLLKKFKITNFSEQTMTFFSNVTLQIIEERKRTGKTRNDFLQLLLDTAKEVSDDGKLDQNEKSDVAENYGKEENDQLFKPNVYSKKTLSHDEIVAQCVIFFLAGYDSVSTTLSFASYLLALNPDIQEKLIEDLDNVLRENNGELEYEALQSMKYLDNVISETFRLFPTVSRLERMAGENYKLGDTGLVIPKGMILTIPVYALHNDPKFYPDPEKFDPDRFTPDVRSKRQEYVFLPFGGGPRKCVAMRFALIQMKVCLVHVLSNFRIKKCPQTKVPLELYINQGLLQPKNITLKLEIRKDAVKAQ